MQTTDINNCMCQFRDAALRFVAALLLAGLAAGPCWALDEIGERLDQAVADGEALSTAAASWRGGERRHHFAGARSSEDLAPPNGQTRYAIGSITKAFTNLLLAERVAHGELGYDTRLVDLLGEDFDPANPAVGQITLQQLATHTSGLPRLPANLDLASAPQDPYADYGEAELIQGVATTRDGQRLGDHYAYSNFGAGLLGWLLGHTAGISYPEALHTEVLRPLRLSETGFEPGENAAVAYAGGEVVPAWTFDALAGAGALWSSVDDLIRLAEVLVGARANPLDHSLRNDFEPVADAGAFEVSRVWHVADTVFGPVFWHNGGTAGHRSFFGVRPATGDALVVLVSGGFDPTGPGLEWFGYEDVEPDRAAPDDSILGQYSISESFGIGVFERDGRVLAQATGQSPFPVTALGDDWYVYDAIDVALRFVREEGEVIAVELVQNGQVQRAERSADRAAVLDRDQSSVNLAPEQLDAYVGEFALNPQMKFTVRRGGESGLEVRLTGQPFLPVFARGDDVFFYKVVEAELHFERDDDGQVNAVVLHQGGIVQRAERVDLDG